MTWDRVQENLKRVSGATKQALGELARSSYGALRGNDLSPERERTDESLRAEREKTDQAMAAKQRDVAKHADAVVDRARDNADGVLSLARENADRSPWRRIWAERRPGAGSKVCFTLPAHA